MRGSRLRAAAVGTALTVSVGSALAAIVRPHVIDLGVANSSAARYAEASAVNGKGMIVGDGWPGSLPNRHVPIAWTPARHGWRVRVLSIGSDSASGAYFTAVNDGGEVVGADGRPGAPGERAFTWTEGRLVWLPDLVSDVLASSVALGVNDDGVAVGWSADAAGRQRAVAWKGGRVMNIGAKFGNRDSSAVAINADGTVIGTSWTGDSADTTDEQGFLWDNGVVTRLSPLNGDRQSRVYALNAGGVVVGESDSAAGRARAVVWHAGKPAPLAGIPKGYESSANGVNTRGQIVGEYWKGDRGFAFVLNGGTLTTLGTLEGISSAAAINDSGLIVGSSTTRAGVSHAVAWHAPR